MGIDLALCWRDRSESVISEVEGRAVSVSVRCPAADPLRDLAFVPAGIFAAAFEVAVIGRADRAAVDRAIVDDAFFGGAGDFAAAFWLLRAGFAVRAAVLRDLPAAFREEPAAFAELRDLAALLRDDFPVAEDRPVAFFVPRDEAARPFELFAEVLPDDF